MRQVLRKHSTLTISLFFIGAVAVAAINGLWTPTGISRGSLLAYDEGARGLLAGINPYPSAEWVLDPDRPLISRYVYSPSFALFYFPFSLSTGLAGTAAWIIATTAVFWMGVLSFIRSFENGVSLVRGKWLLLVAVMLFNETLKCALCLQVNGLIAGMVLLGVGLYFNGRKVPAALLLALATNFKLFPIVLALLLFLEFDLVFIGSFLFFLAAAFALPLLVASPAFNAELLKSWWFFIAHDTVKPGFLGLEPSLLFFGFNVSGNSFMVFTLINALALAGVAYLVFRKEPGRFIVILVPLALAFMLLFNKRTESPTFVVVLPILALMLHAFLEGRNNGQSKAGLPHLATMIFAWWLISLSYSDLTPPPLRRLAHQYRFMFFGLLVMYGWGLVQAVRFIRKPATVP